jgi:hypothetical protein
MISLTRDSITLVKTVYFLYTRKGYDTYRKDLVFTKVRKGVRRHKYTSKQRERERQTDG